MVEAHGIAYHERKHGELFCDASAQQIIDMLTAECAAAGVELFLKYEIQSAERTQGGYLVMTDRGRFESGSLIVATGGLSLPKFGATSIGHVIAESFGLGLVKRAPALDGFVLSEDDRKKFTGFSGIALDAVLTTNAVVFRENLLFTHAGFSGLPSGFSPDNS